MFYSGGNFLACLSTMRKCGRLHQHSTVANKYHLTYSIDSPCMFCRAMRPSADQSYPLSDNLRLLNARSVCSTARCFVQNG